MGTETSSTGVVLSSVPVLYVGPSSSIFFSGMEADRNVKVVGGDVAIL